MKFKLFKFGSISSTNDFAIQLIKKENKKCGCVIAEKQTKGKGTYGKRWVSKKGNLFGSFFFPLKRNYPPFNEFSIINPVLISNVIKNFCKKDNVSLKFPNDIFLNGKKVCGILQELVTINKKKFLIIGIGLNIISNPKINKKYKATNIFKETKKKLKINIVIKKLIFSYERFFRNLSSYMYITFKTKINLLN